VRSVALAGVGALSDTIGTWIRWMICVVRVERGDAESGGAAT